MTATTKKGDVTVDVADGASIGDLRKAFASALRKISIVSLSSIRVETLGLMTITLQLRLKR